MSITGVTHLVRASGRSVFRGEERREVESGDELVIETEDKLRSRRGPNQEIYSSFDVTGEHLYRWFRVVSVNGEAVGEPLYVRDETFDHEETVAERPAKRSDFQRDRLSEADLDIAGLVSRIIDQAPSAPGAADVAQTVQEHLTAEPGGHDPMDTLRFLSICHAVGTNQELKDLAEENEATARRVVDFIGGATRQIVQFWDQVPEDIADRKDAWEVLRAGIDALQDKPAILTEYLKSCLVHDKGYAQCFEATQSFLTIEAELAPQDRSVGELLEVALSSVSNTNIWGLGMKGSGPVSEQLQRTGYDESIPSAQARQQEEMMWAMVLSQLFNAGSGEEPEALGEKLKAGEEQIYTRVRALVPGSFPLHEDALRDALDYF